MNRTAIPEHTVVIYKEVDDTPPDPAHPVSSAPVWPVSPEIAAILAETPDPVYEPRPRRKMEYVNFDDLTPQEQEAYWEAQDL